jgi:hypothetical protein
MRWISMPVLTFLAVIVTPGIKAPVPSETDPPTVAFTCALSPACRKAHQNTNMAALASRFMFFPSEKWTWIQNPKMSS